MTTHKYEYDFDPNQHSTAAHVCRLVGHNKKVLELGCATGSMTKVLTHHYQCKVTGIEYDASAAIKAEPYCVELFVRDLEAADALNDLSAPYDVIVLADVLEHLRQPEQMLNRLLPLLRPDGHVVISVPNIAHNGILAQLWCGQFNYTETGILDQTHLRFFTATTLAQLLQRVGLEVTETQAINTGPEHPEFAAYWEQLPPELHQLLEQNLHGQAYQIVMQATPVVSTAPKASLSFFKKLRQHLQG